MDNAMNELWRAQQDAATRLTESWRTLLQPAADRAAQPPTPPEADDPAQEPVDVDAGYTIESDTSGEVAEAGPSALEVIQAIQALSQGQRDFAHHMTRWAELQHGLADSLTAWATRQRDYADALDGILTTFSGPGSV